MHVPQSLFRRGSVGLRSHFAVRVPLAWRQSAMTRPAQQTRLFSYKHFTAEGFQADLEEFLQKESAVVLDVRTAEEVAAVSVPSAVHIPIDQVPDRIAELPMDLRTPICVFCAAGQRSAMVKSFLERVGYEDVLNGGTVSQVNAAVATNAALES